MKHNIKIDFHEAKSSIDDICILGAAMKGEEGRKQLTSLNMFIRDIWQQSLKQQDALNAPTQPLGGFPAEIYASDIEDGINKDGSFALCIEIADRYKQHPTLYRECKELKEALKGLINELETKGATGKLIEQSKAILNRISNP